MAGQEKGVCPIGIVMGLFLSVTLGFKSPKYLWCQVLWRDIHRFGLK